LDWKVFEEYFVELKNTVPDAEPGEYNFKVKIRKDNQKTLKELKIINLANQYTNEIRKKYGLSAFNILPENVHIIKKDKWPKEGDAFYSSMMQAIALREQSASIVFMKKVVHEMLHFKSYNSLQIITGNNSKISNPVSFGI